ncbi:hypothetical protein GRX03_15435 [Halovenus sp. WSH3]|uniref:Uncharacterized protein n=1 Tax=Halovenus carboxidivorans TaxID=2692199 RepID=A0A6B0TCM8_9EURY|nr:alginate lyase family protein [Halovenus carboxidivorans]MXR52991.1 hypothetical protein [Halovenus carboxidivorans]
MSHDVLTPKGLSLRYHTARRMEARQLAGIAERTVRAVLAPRVPVDFDGIYDRRVPDDPQARPRPLAENTATLRTSLDETTRSRYQERAEDAAGGTFTFLNRTLHLADGDGVAWTDGRLDRLPLLWALKLYAFQPLQWLCASTDPESERAPALRERFDECVRDWIGAVEVGSAGYLRGAWTPWAVSLRILNLSRYLAWRSSDETSSGGVGRELRREIYKNALFLRNHIERDVGGNHLIENGAALVVAGVLFEHRGWRETGQAVLTEAADKQFLDDGYHFERSPMYHVIVLTRYLTACHLLRVGGYSVPSGLRTTARDGVEFLRFLRPPDRGLPLLNDSVHGEGLPLGDCLRYGTAVGFETDAEQWEPPTNEATPETTSGYHWLRTGAGAMLIDGGAVGPAHLPGHSHSDTLSLLLWIDDQPVATDTGTFGYVDDCRRDYARSARGHNTVTVGSDEPIAVGGTYLMGPRPTPETRFDADGVTQFAGRYRALPHRGNAYTHERNVYADDDWWLLTDRVDDSGDRTLRGRIHLHPGIEPSIESSGRVRLPLEDGGRAFVLPDERTDIGVTTGPYFPRFGECRQRAVLELTPTGPNDRGERLRALFTKRDVDPESIDVTDTRDGPRRLVIGEQGYDLPEPGLSRR